MTSDELLAQLEKAVIATETDGVRVSTHCLYPSNGAVTVLVRGGNDMFVVSDDGGAIKEIDELHAKVRRLTLRSGG